MNTLVFPQRPSSRPPLRFRELQPGWFTRGMADITSLELEVRGILAARYADEHRVARIRHDLATDYLSLELSAQRMLLDAFDAQNASAL